MHFGIFTYGSRGDVQPFIALSLGLMEQGHRVSLFAPENFRDFVDAYGIAFYPLHGNIDKILYSPEGLRVLKTGNTFSLLRLIQKGGKGIQPFVTRDMLLGCKNVEVIIASVLCNAWINCIAEKLNKKWGLITFSPPTTPTKEFPFAGLAFFNNAVYNRFSHRLVQFMYWYFNKKDINSFRQTLSLPVLKTNILEDITTKNILNLYAISPNLIARPKDWNSNSDITGYLALPSKKRQIHKMDEIPGGLTGWLQYKEPPVYIGWGSTPVPDTKLFRDILDEILTTTNLRILFCKGWSQIQELPQHPNLFVVNYSNHEWLLPQCKAAVIHGGAGTVAAVLKAKIPMIIASVFGDQPWWGEIIQNKKIGIHIPFKKLTTKSLLKALEKIQISEIEKNVIEMGEKINNENGLEKALKAINKYFNEKK